MTLIPLSQTPTDNIHGNHTADKDEELVDICNLDGKGTSSGGLKVREAGL